MAREPIYIEECCFNWIRDSCVSGDCPCRCHAEMAQDAGPQPDEMVRLQMALDGANQEIERLRAAMMAALDAIGHDKYLKAIEHLSMALAD